MNPTYPEFREAHVLITGAAAGIGRATALAFAVEGARVTAVDRDAEGLARLAAQGMATRVCDLSDPGGLEKMAAEAMAAAGPVRCLVNNAGVDRRHDPGELDADGWRQMLALNLDHHFLLARAVAPGMAGVGGGAIVNLSSSAWMKLAPRMTAYHAAKAGIVGLTRGLARDLGPLGIRVNAIAPGRVVTERVAAGVTEAWEAETKALQCLPALIEPADIAAGVLWLASGGARMVTGQTLVIDGGVV